MTRWPTIAHWLRSIANWLDAPTITAEPPLLTAARTIVADVSSREMHPKLANAKQARALIRLLMAQRSLEKLFPLEHTRDIRYAIEQAIQELR